MMKQPTVVSTFAGCGGSSLGYEMAGYNELLAIDFDKHACEIFRLNFKCPCWQRDITKVTGKEILDEIKMKPGELDVFDGSPPCQGFSTAGKRRVNDARNDLSRHYLRLAAEIKPKVLVMENVSGMVKGNMRGIFKEILKGFDKAGYNVRVKLLNAKNYGVPQSRLRLFFIGIRKDLDPAELSDIWPRHTGKVITAEEALKGCPEGERLTLKGKRLAYLDRMRPGDSMDQYAPGGIYFNTHKLHPKRPCPTIPKLFGDRFGCFFMHWDRGNQSLSIEELKRLASFPDSFKMTGSYVEKCARIGNAVMPLQMKAVALAVKENVLPRLGKSKQEA
jgi:DNA (cytosine-5)-methyltransferase 1